MLKYLVVSSILVACLYAFASQPPELAPYQKRMAIPPLRSQATKLNDMVDKIECQLDKGCDLSKKRALQKKFKEVKILAR